MIPNSKRPIALIILDGWGVSHYREGNAIALAHTPYYNQICERYPSTTLDASGVSVGLPVGEAGNAEIGHRTMGAGRSVQSEAASVASAIRNGEFLKNKLLCSSLARAAADRKAVHFIGLLGDGGIHSSQETLFALLRAAKMQGVTDAFVHGILDGRDVEPRTADVYVDALEIKMADIGIGRIASLCGRFYGMDTSEHWERTARAYTMLVHAEGERGFDAVTAIRASFLRGISDEFISPIVIEKAPGDPVTTIKKSDLVIFFNHRGDGMVQLVRSLAVPDATSPKPDIETVCLTEYDPALGLPVAFTDANGGNFLCDVFESAGIRNYRISETARAAHVTTFFNGRVRAGESEVERHAFLQTRGRETFETDPESRSFKIADAVIRGLSTVNDGVFIVNVPAAALLAETRSLERTVEAVQFVDTCLGGIVAKMREKNGVTVITSSHSGSENVISKPALEPTPVPFHLIGAKNDSHSGLMSGGTLADVGPTLLGILDIEKPREMTGRDLRIL